MKEGGVGRRKGTVNGRGNHTKNHARILPVLVRPKKAVSFVPMPVEMPQRRREVIVYGHKGVVRSTRTIRSRGPDR